MADLIQIRRDTSSNWSSINPVLAQGELAIETNTGKGKVGNGTSNWNALPYSFMTESGNLVAGDNVTLSGTLSNRLLGAGNVTISVDGGGNVLPMPANRYVYSNFSRGSFAKTWSRQGEHLFIPMPHMLFAENDMRVDRIGFNITGSDNNANVFIRLGIFEQNTVTGVMNRVVDAGQVGTVGAGIKEATLNQVLTKGKMYYVLFARQGFDFVNVAVTTTDIHINSFFYSTPTANPHVNPYGGGPGTLNGVFATSYTPGVIDLNGLPLIFMRLQNV